MSRTSIPSAPAHDPRRRDDGAREHARFTVVDDICSGIARDDSRRDQRGEDGERLGVVAKKAALAPNMSSTTIMIISMMSFAPLVDNTARNTLFSHAHRWWSSHSGRRYRPGRRRRHIAQGY